MRPIPTALLAFVAGSFMSAGAFAQDATDDGDSAEGQRTTRVGDRELIPQAPVIAQNNNDSAAPDVYEVQPGDTLWEICERYWGDSGRWPEVWSVNNQEITNPHYIYPGQKLRFTPGSDVRTPSLLTEGAAPATEDLSFDENFKPVVHFLASNRDCDIQVPFSGMGKTEVTLHAPSFVTRAPVEALGSVQAAAHDKEELGAGDLVYMRFRNPNDVNCGDIYTLYHPMKELRHPEVRSARLGHVHAVSAEVMVTDVSDKWVTGKVLQSFGEFRRGELITDRVPVTGQVRPITLSEDLDGYIIDKSHEENLLIQDKQVVFIDRGRSDKVQAGTTFWVVRRGDDLMLRASRESDLPDQVVGRLVVFAADEHVSTAVLTDQAIEVRIGDRITSRLE